MARPRLLVFLKAPRHGTVKTRLATTLGHDLALVAYRELVAITLGNLAGLAPAIDVELRFAPDDAEAELASWLQPGWRAVPQGAGNLGNRLARAFQNAFADSCPRVVVIGSDCPYLTADDIRAAFEALAQSEVVLGPATDGGYWLLGMRNFRPELFSGIDWSTSQVRAQTLARAHAAGLRVTELRQLSDVDTEAEWRAWQQDATGPLRLPITA